MKKSTKIVARRKKPAPINQAPKTEAAEALTLDGQKSSAEAAEAAKKEDEPADVLLMDGNSNAVIRVLDASAVFFVEATTGSIHVIAKDRVSNFFRHKDGNILFFDRGADHPPADPKDYVTIEEVEDIVEVLEDEAREGAQAAQDQEPKPGADKDK